jgi:hypothetical protein
MRRDWLFISIAAFETVVALLVIWSLYRLVAEP